MNLFDRISGKSINSDSLEQILSGQKIVNEWREAHEFV